MKFIRTAFVALLLASFLVSMSGFLMYYAECACTGEISASLYTAPEECNSCEKESTVCHAAVDHPEISIPEDSCCNENSEDGCGINEACACVLPEPLLYRIDDQFSVAELVPVNFQIWKLLATVEFENIDVIIQSEIYSTAYQPPPPIAGLRGFIHFICQSKIPSIA